MSRIGKEPVKLAEGVTATVAGQTVRTGTFSSRAPTTTRSATSTVSPAR